jgi:hypothetical protein
MEQDVGAEAVIDELGEINSVLLDDIFNLCSDEEGVNVIFYCHSQIINYIREINPFLFDFGIGDSALRKKLDRLMWDYFGKLSLYREKYGRSIVGFWCASDVLLSFMAGMCKTVLGDGFDDVTEELRRINVDFMNGSEFYETGMAEDYLLFLDFAEIVVPNIVNLPDEISEERQEKLGAAVAEYRGLVKLESFDPLVFSYAVAMLRLLYFTDFLVDAVCGKNEGNA